MAGRGLGLWGSGARGVDHRAREGVVPGGLAS